MKNFLLGIFVTVPLTALVLYFALSGRQEVLIQQHRHEIQHELDKEIFDRDFQAAWERFDATPSRQAQSAEAQARDARIAELRKRREHFDREFDQAWKRLDTELSDMREAMANPPQH